MARAIHVSVPTSNGELMSFGDVLILLIVASAVIAALLCEPEDNP
jgi:hypothetical protein